MKNLKINVAAMALAVVLFSCGKSSNEGSETKADSVKVDVAQAVAEETQCFLLTEGDKNQDSTKISLTFKGNEVSGTMDWLPNEKDGAYGSIVATKEGNIIKGTYAYTIEGSEQSEEVEFKIENGKLWKKTGELVEKAPNSADLVFKDASKAKFDQEFQAVKCW